MTGIAICLSKRWDSDLISLYNEIGSRQFNNLCLEALKSIVRPSFEGTVRKMIRFTPTTVAQAEKDVRTRLSISSKKDEDVRMLVDHIKPNQKSHFAKQALRYYIGPYYCLGSMLTNNRKSCNNLDEKELFFMSVPVIQQQVVKNVSAPVVTTVETVAKEEKPISTSVPEPIKNEPVTKDDLFDDSTNLDNSTPTDAPMSDEDDILALLESL